VLLQKQVECKTKSALGKTVRAAMTCRATIRKQPGGRLALIEILGVRRAADHYQNCAKGE
jgi:hypothetical protein